MNNVVIDSDLANARPSEKRYRIQVGGNTYLEVLPTGRKVWRMRYNDPSTKKPAIYTLGDYPDIPLTDIPDLARSAKKLIASGVNPTEQRTTEKERIKKVSKFQTLHTKSKEYEDMINGFIVIGAMATTGGDAEEAARLLGVTVDFINERF